MKKMIFVSLLFFLFFGVSSAQSRKVVLLEEATNASCPDCGVLDPALHEMAKNNFGLLIPLQYHAWWPGTDPMYSANTQQNTDRIEYYNYNYVPTTSIDGVFYGEPVDAQDIRNVAMIYAGFPTPINLSVENLTVSSDSVMVAVKINSSELIASSEQLKLRCAVVEKEIHFDTPPGSNGMTEFGFVMRKLIPSSDGISLGELNTGTDYNYSASCAIEDGWNTDDLDVVCWVQSDANKSVYQAATSRKLFLMTANGSEYAYVESGQDITRDYTIYNDNDAAIPVRIKPEITENTGNWGVSVSSAKFGAAEDSLDVVVQPGENLNVTLTITSNENEGEIDLTFKAFDPADVHEYGMGYHFYGWRKSGDVLVIDNDDGAKTEEKLLSILDDFSVDYQILDADLFMQILSGRTIPFGNIVVHNGGNRNAMSDAFFTMMTDFAEGGGNLLVEGQDFGASIFGTGDPSSIAVNFYSNILGAEYIADTYDGMAVEGVPASGIGNDLAFNINTMYPRNLDIISPKTGISEEIFKYADTDSSAGLKVETSKYKSVYTTFGPEQIIPKSKAAIIVERILNFFGVIETGVNDLIVPKEFVLYQNYPNPFNPSTSIGYQLPEQGFAKLSIFNLLGQKVLEPVNRIQAAGLYNINLSNEFSKLSSGVYIYKLDFNNQSLSKKMMYIK